MKCQCSLNSNYKIIEMCDIKEFNSKISKFMDKSYTQLVISKPLIIPEEKFEVKEIHNIKLAIKIIKTNIILTSSSGIPNIEGFKSTGKTLSIHGEICEKTFYISDNINAFIHSINSTIPFNAKIVLETNSTTSDVYDIYPCIENISTYVVNPRTINRSLRLFLFAHKLT